MTERVEPISWSRRCAISAWRSCSAIPAARSCRSTMRCSAAGGSSTSSSATNRPRPTRRRAMPARPASPASCSSPRGPGATNAVTGITDALMDSIPMVVITGQVPTALIGTDAFQEADTVGITRHCSKHNYLVKDPAKLGDVIHEAFHIATSAAPARSSSTSPRTSRSPPRATASPARSSTRPIARRSKADPPQIEQVVDMLAAAERPILYTGGGIINSGPGASQLLRELARDHRRAGHLDADGPGLPSRASDPQLLGMLGMHGTYEANQAMNQADLVVAIGARFDDRVTGRLDAFSPNSRKVHIDIDRSIDQQDGARRPADRRRRRPRAGGHGPHLEGAPASQARPDRLVRAASPDGAPRSASTSPRPATTARSCRSARSARCGRRRTPASRSSRPRSASTRCGPRSISGSRSRTSG